MDKRMSIVKFTTKKPPLRVTGAMAVKTKNTAC
jgi:hypothetical protein